MRKSSSRRGILADALCVGVLVAYFLHFAVQSLPAHFRADDLRNMVDYWSLGWWNALRANLRFWSSARPLAALYYLPLHAWFDLNPRPFRIATIALVAAAIPLAYAAARSLTRSRSVGFLAAFAWCYHPQLANLVFINAFIFDVLCSLFYFAALALYVSVREQDRVLRSWEVAAIFLFYVCALNAKEMAVTLPLLVLIYEILRYYHAKEREPFLHWVGRYTTPALVGGAIAAVYLYAKTYGPGGVMAHPEFFESYIPHYSWEAFIASNSKFLSQFLFLFPKHNLSGAVLLAMWGFVFCYAFLRRDRVLELMAFWVVLTPLPLAFVAPRGGAPLVVILFGWAMIFANAVADLAMLIAKSLVRNKLPPRLVRVASVVLFAVALAGCVERQHSRVAPGWLRVGAKEAQLIEAFRALNLQPKPGSRILLTIDAVPDIALAARTARNIAILLWNDHSLSVDVARVDAIGAGDAAAMDYVLAVHEDKVDVLRQPL